MFSSSARPSPYSLINHRSSRVGAPELQDPRGDEVDLELQIGDAFRTERGVGRLHLDGHGEVDERLARRLFRQHLGVGDVGATPPVADAEGSQDGQVDVGGKLAPLVPERDPHGRRLALRPRVVDVAERHAVASGTSVPGRPRDPYLPSLHTEGNRRRIPVPIAFSSMGRQ
jgi:hypothetical protein